MRKAFFYCIITVLVLTLALPADGCGSSGKKTYANSQYGFTVDYPAGWAMEEGVSGSIVIFKGPVMEETGGRVNINITNEQLPESSNTSAEDYLNLTDTQLAKGFANYAKLETSDLTVSGIPAKKMIYVFDMQGFNLKANQVYLIEDHNAFTITFVAAPDSYDKYTGESDMVINSFKLN